MSSIKWVFAESSGVKVVFKLERDLHINKSAVCFEYPYIFTLVELAMVLFLAVCIIKCVIV